MKYVSIPRLTVNPARWPFFAYLKETFVKCLSCPKNRKQMPVVPKKKKEQETTTSILDMESDLADDTKIVGISTSAWRPYRFLSYSSYYHAFHRIQSICDYVS